MAEEANLFLSSTKAFDFGDRPWVSYSNFLVSVSSKPRFNCDWGKVLLALFRKKLESFLSTMRMIKGWFFPHYDPDIKIPIKTNYYHCKIFTEMNIGQEFSHNLLRNWMLRLNESCNSSLAVSKKSNSYLSINDCASFDLSRQPPYSKSPSMH